MNTNTFLKNKLMLFASIILCIQGFAQNQSMLLPVPGIYSTSTNDYEGCKIINFSNPGNPVIYELPKHTFYVEGIQGRPHDEYDLGHADPSMNEKYLGQHPMFAQNIVHDKDGKLLFFIVDNNIYNRYGEAFLKYLPDYPEEPINNDIFSYLHDGIMYDNWIDGSNFNRFNVNTSNISIDPEIVIFPIYGECYKYGLVYFLFYNNAPDSASKLFYRTLTYYNENKIVLSNPIEISKNFPLSSACNNYSNRGLAISEYREEYDNYLLFVHYYDILLILTIDNTGNIDTNNFIDYTIIENMINPTYFHNQYSTEMEVIKLESGSDTYYKVAMSSCYGGTNSSDALVTEFTLNYDSLNVVDKWAYYLPMNTSTTDSFFREYIKGLEYDPNGNLYVTYRGQGHDKLYYHIAGSSNLNYIDMQDKYYNASNYQYSEIELGRDGNLYYLYSNENETSGGISRFNLNSLTLEENVFPDVINKVYFSHDYGFNSDESKILLFADQIDGSDYVSYYETVDQQCCIDHIYYDTWPSQQYFDQNPVWTWSPGIGNNPFQSINGEILINEDVKIYSGKEVTIKNLKFKFNSNKKLIIEPGAKLVLDNSVLTSVDNCEQSIMWQGIEVWGNRDLPQYPESNQGVVELKNGATIENARCAITTCQKDAEGNILWAYTGGIIHAKDANFINNRKAIEFLSYHNILPNGREIANSSYFNNCTFETNAQLSDPGTLPETFVSLYDVKGVKFLGCTFQNTAPTGVYSTIHRGNGITSIDASYEVKPLCLNPYIYPCSEYQSNTFQNLYYGIYASNTNPAITLTISGNNFDNNHRSIFLKSINNATITKNNFDIGASIVNINDQPNEREECEACDVFNRSYSYGVYLKECSGYKVEENNFSTTHDGHAGIIVNNSGTKANEIYNNTFDKLAIGTQAQGVNAAGGVIISKSSNPEHIEINVGQGCNFYVISILIFLLLILLLLLVVLLKSRDIVMITILPFQQVINLAITV